MTAPGGASPPPPLPRQTSTDVVTEQLRDLIVERRIAPGARLLTDDLADRLGVSRAPVREALQRLARCGLVELRPNRGARVASVDLADSVELVELFTVRLQLEPWIAGQAAVRRDGDDLARLRAIVDTGTAAMGDGDLSATSRAHHDLMVAIPDAAHRPSAAAAFEPLRNRSILAFAAMAPDLLPDGWPSHVRVVAAIEAGEPATASRETAEHLTLLIAAAQERSGPMTVTGSY